MSRARRRARAVRDRLGLVAIRAAWAGTELVRIGDARSMRVVLDRTAKAWWSDIVLARERPAVLPDPQGRVVIVDFMFPDPQRDSGSDRISRLARMARWLGRPTTVLSLLYRQGVDVVDDVDPNGTPSAVRMEPNEERWSAAEFWQRIGEADVIWLERPEVAARLLNVLGPARHGRRIIFSTNDLHFVRIGREAELSGQRVDRWLSSAYRRLETRLLRAADVTLAITPEEAAVVRSIEPTADVVVVPNVHEARSGAVPSRAGRSGLVFVGNFAHPPNGDAVQHLLEVLMPRLWEHAPDVELSVVGARLPDAWKAGQDPRVHMIGWVEDLMPVLDGAAAMVAPLRFGAGMKGKIGLAMAYGLPTVTTSVGAEGLGLTDGVDALVADDDAGFVDRCLLLLRDDQLWASVSANGRQQVARNWSADAIMPVLSDVLERRTPS